MVDPRRCRLSRKGAPLVAAAVVLGGAITGLVHATTPPLRFSAANVFVEINATDGDAGLQLDLDGEAWRSVEIVDPGGRPIVRVSGESRLSDYGLTGLTFESAEPSFDEQPLSRFEARFPAGVYRFRGTTVDGRRVVGADRLTHVFPRGPDVTSPRAGAVVPQDGLVVTWNAVTRPAGVRIVRYEVIVEHVGSGRALDMALPPTARRAPIPQEFLTPRSEHRVEVLARESSGNQTITEVAFRVG
jgi:hypothetical protein